MAATSTSQPAAKSPRRFWRFSLRALLIFFTLVCVGVWYWYRVPYRQEVLHSQGQFLFYEMPVEFNAAKEVRHYRRVLRGEPIREGLTEYFDAQGHRIGQEQWREGRLHGPFLRWYPDGNARERGEYHLGAKTGVWELFDPSENLVLRTPYDQNWPHGDGQWFEGGKLIRTVRYDHGEVTQIDGRPVLDPLGRALRNGQIDHEHSAQMLDKPFQAEFRQCPLNEVAELVTETYKVNVKVDKRALQDAGLSDAMPINLRRLDRITSHSALILICEPHDLAATYRFGMIWITTQDSAKNWVDRTGISELLDSPPREVSPADRARLRAALERPFQVDFLDTPLLDVAKYIAELYRLPLECEASVKDVLVTGELSGISLHHGLGVLCDQNGLRIGWQDEKALVIEPQEQPGEPATKRSR